MAKEVERKISCLGNEVYLNLFSTFVMAEKQRNVFLNNQLTVNTPLKYERKWNKLFWISGLSIKVKYSNALRLLMIFSFLLKNQKLVISGIIIFCQWRIQRAFLTYITCTTSGLGETWTTSGLGQTIHPVAPH